MLGNRAQLKLTFSKKSFRNISECQTVFDQFSLDITCSGSIKYLLASGDFDCLLITFANIWTEDVESNGDTNCLTL